MALHIVMAHKQTVQDRLALCVKQIFCDVLDT